jgi:hypothetical protein
MQCNKAQWADQHLTMAPFRIAQQMLSITTPTSIRPRSTKVFAIPVLAQKANLSSILTPSILRLEQGRGLKPYGTHLLSARALSRGLERSTVRLQRMASPRTAPVPFHTSLPVPHHLITQFIRFGLTINLVAQKLGFLSGCCTLENPSLLVVVP